MVINTFHQKKVRELHLMLTTKTYLYIIIGLSAFETPEKKNPKLYKE